MGRPKSVSKIKKCKKCEVTKSKKFFYTTSSYCKKCHREEVIENQKKKADYYNEYRSQYTKAHPEKCKEWVDKTKERWEKENGIPYSTYSKERHKKRMIKDMEYADMVRESTKRYRTKNKEKIKVKREKYYQENKEVLLLKASLKYYRKALTQVDNDPKLKKEYEKKIKALEKQITSLQKK